MIHHNIYLLSWAWKRGSVPCRILPIAWAEYWSIHWANSRMKGSLCNSIIKRHFCHISVRIYKERLAFICQKYLACGFSIPLIFQTQDFAMLAVRLIAGRSSARRRACRCHRLLFTGDTMMKSWGKLTRVQTLWYAIFPPRQPIYADGVPIV